MRARLLFLLVAILAVAGFAALNWAEITRPSPLLLGPVVMDAPLGLILLSLLGIALVAFVLSAATMRTQNLVESRHHYKSLEAQRELADKAEASRFTELREFMTSELQRVVQASAESRASLLQRMEQLEQRQRLALEETGNSLSAYIGELEDRLEHHVPPQGAPSLAPRGPDRGRTF